MRIIKRCAKYSIYFCYKSSFLDNPKIGASFNYSQTLIILVNNLYFYRNLVKLFKLLKWFPEPLPIGNTTGCPAEEEHVPFVGQYNTSESK